jgi:hypothetical protein
VNSLRTEGIEIANEQIFFSDAEIDKDIKYLNLFVDEIMGLNNKIIVMFATPTQGKLILE